MEDTASTHIMAHDQDITHIGLEDPRESFLIFARAWIKPDLEALPDGYEDKRKDWQFEKLPEDALRFIYESYSAKLTGLHQPAVKDLDPALVEVLKEKGRLTPPTTPRLTPEAPAAPIGPPRPTRVAQASGQPLAAVRALFFGAVPAGVPDA